MPPPSSRLIIGPNLKRELFDPYSFFWHHPANYNVHPLAFQTLDGRYVAANHSFANMARRPLGDIIGKRPRDIFDPEVATSIEEAMNRYKLQGIECVINFWQTFSHGPQLYVSCTMERVVDPSGEIGLFSKFYDNTKTFLAEEAMLDTMHILQHDLQNPLSAALYYLSECLLPNCPHPELRSDLVFIRTLCQQAKELIQACFHTHDSIGFPFDLHPEWNSPHEVERQLATAIQSHAPGMFHLSFDRTVAEPLFWPIAGLSHAITSLLDILCESAQPQAPSNLSIRFLSDIQEHRVVIKTSDCLANRHMIQMRLITHSEILKAKALGIRVHLLPEGNDVGFDLRIPRPEMIPSPPPPSTSLQHVAHDYQGESFDTPYSLYQARFDLAGDCVAMLDMDNRICACSLGFAKQFQRLPEDLTGRHYHEFASPSLAAHLDDLLIRSSTDDSPRLKLCMACIDGSITWGHLVFVRAREGGHALHIYDRLQEQYFLFLRQHLEDALVLVRNMLRNIGEAYSRLQARPDLSPDCLFHINWLTQANMDMLKMTDLFLLTNSLDSAPPHLSLQRIDVPAVLRFAQDSAHGVRWPFQLTIAPNLLDQSPGLAILGDPALLKFMFLNLLKNAHEASSQKCITMHVDMQTPYIRFILRNDGEVPPAIRGQFFEKRSKGSCSQGMGLGTYSARLTVDLHGGHISLDTSEIGYTTLRVLLPLEHNHPPLGEQL